MRALIIGGTGLISTGIVKHLTARGAEVTMFNRGKRAGAIPPQAVVLHGDRDNFSEFERAFKSKRFDVVIDMVCFSKEQAESAVRAFAGRCEQFIFCSTVCSYGVKISKRVLVDETFLQEPASGYGRGKVDCENIFMRAHAAKQFKTTIIRPSMTYGPGGPLIDQLEFNPPAWDRIEKGLPVLAAGDGLGLWQATHRDDCGKLFAYGALNPKTYGQAYNATREEIFTWRDYYRQAAAALGRKAQLLFMPAQWIIKRAPERFGLLEEITQYHGAYDSGKARREVPEYQCKIGFVEGARETLEDARRRGVWRDSSNDQLYQDMVDAALKTGAELVEA